MLAEVKDAIESAQQNGTAFADFKSENPHLMAKGWWGEEVMTDPLDGERKLLQLGSTRRLKTIFNTICNRLRRGSGSGYRQTKSLAVFALQPFRRRASARQP